MMDRDENVIGDLAVSSGSLEQLQEIHLNSDGKNATHCLHIWQNMNFQSLIHQQDYSFILDIEDS